MSDDRPPTLPGFEELAPPERLADLPAGATPARIIAQVRAQVARRNRHDSTIVGKAVSDGRRRTMEREALLERGWHPLTKLPLLVGTGETCGDCSHHRKIHHRTSSYHKCELAGITHGPGTDLRVGWPACQRFEADR